MKRTPRCTILLATLFSFACSSDDGADANGGQAGASGGASAGAAAGGAPPIAGAPSAGMATAGSVSGAPGAAGSIGGSTEVAGASGSVATAGATAGTAGSSFAGAGGALASGGSAGALAGAGAGGTGGAAGGLTDPGTQGDGDIVLGPTYTKSPDVSLKSGVMAGKNFSFTMKSSASMFYKGTDTTLNNPMAFERTITVRVPARYRDGTAAPFMVVQDGAGGLYNRVRDAVENLSQSTDPERRVPAVVIIAVANGGGDSKGSQRGLEYDTMSERYARFIDEEVIPAVVANAQIKAAYPNFALTNDPEGRGTVGCSSGGSAAVTMGWFKPDRFRRIIAYSATLVDQQDDDAPEEAMYRRGAWEYHSELSLIANSPQKPLRIMINANQNDNGAGQTTGYHNWLEANRRTAAALKAKGYHYRYVYGQSAGHCDAKVYDADVPETVLWLWRGYPLTP